MGNFFRSSEQAKKRYPGQIFPLKKSFIRGCEIESLKAGMWV